MPNLLQGLKNIPDDILNTLGTNNSSQIATAVLAGFKIFFIPLATSRDKLATPEQKKYTMTRDVITESLALTTYLGGTYLVQKSTTGPICKSYYKNFAKKIELGKIKPKQALNKEEIGFLKNVDTKKIKEIGTAFITEKSSHPKKASEEALDYSKQFDAIITKINGESKNANPVELKKFVSDLSKNGLPKEKKGLSVLINDFKSAAKGSTEIANPKSLFKNTRIALSQVSVWVLALAVIPPLCNLIITPVMKMLKTKKQNNNPVEPPRVETKVANVNTQKDQVTFGKSYYKMASLGNMRVG